MKSWHCEQQLREVLDRVAYSALFRAVCMLLLLVCRNSKDDPFRFEALCHQVRQCTCCCVQQR